MLDRWTRCGVCVLLAFGLSGCLYQDLEVLEVEEFSKVKLSFDGLECRMDVDVYNPNPYAVTVTEADVKLLVKDDLVGEVAVLEPTQIRPDAQATVPLHVETYDGALGKVLKNDLMNLIKGNHVPFEARGSITGKAFGLTLSVPLRHEQSLKLRK